MNGTEQRDVMRGASHARLSRRAWLGLAAALVPWTGVARAGDTSLSQLVRQATSVVALVPRRRQCTWQHVFGARRIVSQFECEVLRTVAGGRGDATLQVCELGGQVDDLVQRVSHAAPLQLHAPSLVFLTPERRPGAPKYWVLGMAQGCLPLVRTADGGWAVDGGAGATGERAAFDSAAAQLAGLSLGAVALELERLLRT